MKLADIEIGKFYMFSESNGMAHRPSRCLVLDTDPIYINTQNSTFYAHDNTVVTRPPEWFKYRHKRGRIAVALEKLVWNHQAEINPETGQPWTDEELHITPLEASGVRWSSSRHRTKGIIVARLWVPWAASPGNLKGLWERDWLAEEAVEQELSYRARIIQQERDLEQRKQREAEEARKQEQREKERALRDEFYETRLEPTLVELGIDHSHSSMYDEGKITLTYDQMQRLLRHVKEEG